MTDSFAYSAIALENKASFYDKNFTVYVEGDEDVMFWHHIFIMCGSADFHIESAGSKEQLNEYAQTLVQHDLNIIVAFDSDYSAVDKSYYENAKIIYTYGYSIENSMYRTKKINEIIQNLSKQRVNFETEIDNWKSEFTAEISDMLVLDYLSYRNKKYIEVLGRNACKFLTSNTSLNLSKVKIKKFITENKSFFNKRELQIGTSEIESSNVEKWYLIRGHFLTNAVFNYIRTYSQRISKSKVHFTLDSLYAMSVNCISYKNENDIASISKNVSNALKKITK